MPQGPLQTGRERLPRPWSGQVRPVVDDGAATVPPEDQGKHSRGQWGHRSAVPRPEVNWYPGRKDYPKLGPGVYHQARRILMVPFARQASRSFLTKTDAIMLLPGSRRGFHSFLNSGRSKRLMGDAVLFKTARADGEHLGPGSYDLPPTLNNGRRPSTAPEASLRVKPQQTRPRSRLRRVVSSTSSVNRTQCLKGSVGAAAGLYVEEEEERAAAVNAVRALPELHVR
ncbi:unnamed protein product [Ectocarpus sp. 6 AP-2014]